MADQNRASLAPQTSRDDPREPLSGLEYLRFVDLGGVAILTINRPQVHNAVSLATMAEIERVRERVARCVGWVAPGIRSAGGRDRLGAVVGGGRRPSLSRQRSGYDHSGRRH